MSNGLWWNLPTQKAACKILVKSTSGVNFINVLRAAFAHADSKSAKRIDNLMSFLCFCATHVKSACRTLMKLASGGWVFTNHYETNMRDRDL